MKNRILKISINDIIIDPEGQSKMITAACHREIPMVATGVCQVGENLLVTLEENRENAEVEYVMAPFESVNIDEIVTEISTRFYAGFSLVGGFDVKLFKWALFGLKKEM